MSTKFTNDDFHAFLVGRKLTRLAELVGEYPDVVAPFLPKIHAKLVAKGLIVAPAGVVPSDMATPLEVAAVFRNLAADPTVPESRRRLVALLADAVASGRVASA